MLSETINTIIYEKIYIYTPTKQRYPGDRKWENNEVSSSNEKKKNRQ